MSLLRSKSLRVFFNQNDYTEQARTWDGDPLPISSWGVNDALYIGRPHKFGFIYALMDIPNSDTNSVVAEYWNGSAFVALSDFLDETDAFKNSGFLQWDQPTEWQAETLDGVQDLTQSAFVQKFYWIRISLPNNNTAQVRIQALKAVFSDDRLMQTIHPEILNYLPQGQLNFLPQHELAKDSIVNGLITEGTIAYEEQLKNPEDWLLAASYRCIEIILDPIAGDDKLDKVKGYMKNKAAQYVRDTSAAINTGPTEDLDPSQAEVPFTGSIGLFRR